MLDECQRPLRGRMDRVSAIVTLPDGAEYQLFAQLPDQLRVQAGSERLLLVGDRIARIDGDAAVPAADAARVRALRTLLDAAAFGPLQRATGCKRLGPATFALTQPAGGAVTLELRAQTLLPGALTLPGGTVRIVDYVPQPVTWIPRTVELDGLGRCRVHFVDAAVDWAEDFFRLPPEKAPKSDPGERTRVAVPGASREKRSPTPVAVDGRQSRWVVLADPGDWPGRVVAYQPVHAELERQGQLIFGFPHLWQQDGKRWLGVPFRAREGGKQFVAPAEWQIRDVPAARLLEVFPPTGDLAARIADGERLLQEAMKAQGLTAAGPITAQPYVHLDEGEPAAAKLAAPVVRLSVPLR